MKNFQVLGLTSVGVASLSVILYFVSVISKQPHLLFNVPKIGWILFFLVKGTEPFVDGEAMTRCLEPNTCEWFAPDDVVIAACMKCGTNWLMTTVHELRTWDKPHLKDFNDILQISPWLELRQFPSDLKETKHERWGTEWNHTDLPFKQYKSHLLPHLKKRGIKSKLLPIEERPDVKYLAMVRNPQDVLISMKYFAAMSNPEFYTPFGGFSSPQMSLATLIWMLELMGPDALFLGFFRAWYEYRDHPNVMLLHYSDVYNNPGEYIRKIAKFIGVTDITEEGLAEVEYRTSVDFMKQGDRYRHRAGVNHSIPMMLPKTLVRKGGVTASGEERELTDEQEERIKKITRNALGEELSILIEEGFKNSPLA